MSQHIELSHIGAIAVAAPVIAVIWVLFAPGYVSRGIVTDLTYSVVGRPYVARIHCDGEQASLLEIATGQGPNQYRIRAADGADATMALQAAFPGCEIGHPRSEGPPGWMKLLAG